jgi:hypothetical protein
MAVKGSVRAMLPVLIDVRLATVLLADDDDDTRTVVPEPAP